MNETAIFLRLHGIFFFFFFRNERKNWRKTQRFQKTFGNRLLCAVSMNVENVLGVRKKGFFSDTPSISFRTPSASTATAGQLPRVSLECIIKIIIIGRLFYWYTSLQRNRKHLPVDRPAYCWQCRRHRRSTPSHYIVYD